MCKKSRFDWDGTVTPTTGRAKDIATSENPKNEGYSESPWEAFGQFVEAKQETWEGEVFMLVGT